MNTNTFETYSNMNTLHFSQKYLNTNMNTLKNVFKYLRIRIHFAQACIPVTERQRLRMTMIYQCP